MPHIPLEDTFADLINKVQRGKAITDVRLASIAGVSLEDLLSVKEGKPLLPVLRRIARHLRLNPDALEAMANRAWYPKIPLFPRGFAMFNSKLEDMTVNSYLVWDSRSRQALAFDSGADAGDMLDFIRSEKLVVQAILLTHTHEDHIADLDRLVAETKAPVFSHEAEPLEKPYARTFKDNAFWHVGELAAKGLLIGGHSPGLCAYFVTGLSWPVAVVGDSFFSSSIGGSKDHFNTLYQAVHARLLGLPRDTVIAAGHGPLSTLSQERQHNPCFA